MKPILKYTLIGLLVAVLASITVVGIAYADGDYPPRLEIMAELLGMTEDEIREQFQAGKTLEDLAEEAGIDLDDLKESLENSWREGFQERIQEALRNGDLTEEHANWLTEGLQKGFLGRGRPFGGHHGMGPFNNPDGEKPFGEWPHMEDRPNREPGFNLPHCDE